MSEVGLCGSQTIEVGRVTPCAPSGGGRAKRALYHVRGGQRTAPPYQFGPVVCQPHNPGCLKLPCCKVSDNCGKVTSFSLNAGSFVAASSSGTITFTGLPIAFSIAATSSFGVPPGKSRLNLLKFVAA